MAIVTKTLAQLVTSWENGEIEIRASGFKPVASGNPTRYVLLVIVSPDRVHEVWDVGA